MSEVIHDDNGIPVKTFPNARIIPVAREDLWKALLAKYDIVIVIDDHKHSTFKALAEDISSMKEARAEAICIEISADKQKTINERIAGTITGEEDSEGYHDILASKFLKAAKDTHMPLIGVDTKPHDFSDDIGVGNTQEREAARKAAIAKRMAAGKSAQEAFKEVDELQMQFETTRRKDNNAWVANIERYMNKHQTEKLVIIGGGLHFEGSDGVDAQLEQLTGKRIIKVYAETKPRILQPLITPGEQSLGLGEYPNRRGAYNLFLPASPNMLDAETLQSISQIYDPVYDSKTFLLNRLTDVEGRKSAHADMIRNIKEMESTFEEIFGSKHTEFNKIIKIVAYTDKDREIITNTRKSLKQARELLSENPPRYEQAVAVLKPLQSDLSGAFLGGYDKLISDKAINHSAFHVHMSGVFDSLQKIQDTAFALDVWTKKPFEEIHGNKGQSHSNDTSYFIDPDTFTARIHTLASTMPIKTAGTDAESPSNAILPVKKTPRPSSPSI